MSDGRPATQALEEALIDAFVLKGKRPRLKMKLAHRWRRKEALDEFNHFDDFDPRYSYQVPSEGDVVALLKGQGAPARCHVIADESDLDGQEMDLAEAIEEAEDSSWAFLVGCISGHLAYYKGENGEQRLILYRPIPVPRP